MSRHILLSAVLVLTTLASLATQAADPVLPQLPPEFLTAPVYLQGDSLGTGTAFFMYHRGYCYLVTARHVLYSYSKSKSAWIFGNRRISIASYPQDPGKSQANILQLDLDTTAATTYARCHKTKDVAAIRIGHLDSGLVKYFDFVTKEGPLSSIHAVDSTMVRTYDAVLVGSDVFTLGYPRSIGIENVPQIDYSKPLLRSGVVAGKNEPLRTLILDCPVYPGNSGGPVFERDVTYAPPEIRYEISVIGVAVEYVPFTQHWVNSRHGDSYDALANSGYSVVVPIDDVLDLFEHF